MIANQPNDVPNGEWVKPILKQRSHGILWSCKNKKVRNLSLGCISKQEKARYEALLYRMFPFVEEKAGSNNIDL